ncbi:hypothetical protein [Methyloglobulus morosus]|nr:hypothetical protein [Methyloglobulus morosus]
MVISPDFYSTIEDDQVVEHQPTVDTVKISQAYLQSEPVRGENPSVFKYRFRYSPAEESLAFAAQFYDFFDIYSYSSRSMSDARPKAQ